METYDTLATTPDKDARTWAMVCHISAFAGLVMPFLNIVAPLIVWLLKRENDPFIDDQGREALNFQITVILMSIVVGFLCLVLIGFLLAPVLFLYWIVFTIIGGVKANDGITYRYPFTLRLLN